MDPKVAVFRASLLFVFCAFVDCLLLVAIGLLVGIDVAILVPTAVVLASIWIFFVSRKIDSLILKRIKEGRSYPLLVNKKSRRQSCV